MEIKGQVFFHPIPKWVVLGLFSVFGCALIVVNTIGGGLGTSPDAINYITASKTLNQGEGLLLFAEVPYLTWPPLFPTILAGVNIASRFLGLDTVEGIRFFHALVFGFTVFLSGLLIWRYLHSQVLRLVALVFVACGLPVARMALYAWSEPVATLMSVLFILYLPIVLEQKKLYQFVLLSVLAVLITLQRYAGIGIIPAGMVAITLFMPDAPLSKRLRYAFGFGLAVLPYVLWYFYVRSFSTYTIGSEKDPLGSVLLNLNLTPSLLAWWFFPESLRGWAASAIATLAILLSTTWTFRHYYANKQLPLRNQPVFTAIYGLSHMLFFYIAHYIIHSTPVDLRHLSVIYIPGLLLVFWAIEQIMNRLRSPTHKRAILVAVALMAFHPIAATYADVLSLSGKFGIGDQHRQLALLQWLEANSLEKGRYYSNTPLPLFYSNLPVVFRAPQTLEQWTEKFNQHPDKDLYFIWFPDVDKENRYLGTSYYYFDPAYSETELASIADVNLVIDTGDGKIFRLRKS